MAIEIDAEGRVRAFTGGFLPLIIGVNREGNRTIKWRRDEALWKQPEVWAYPVEYRGRLTEDCDGYVLWKMRRLREQGVPQEALFACLVLTETGEGHLILGIETDTGDQFLDNRQPGVCSLDDLRRAGYRFIGRQQHGAALSDPWLLLPDAVV